VTDSDLDVGVAGLQGLGIGVHRDEFHAAETRVDHPADGVGTAATHSDDLDYGQI
jgi:hypothetical protein